MVFIMNWLRLLIGYPVYITAIPILGWRQGNRQDRVWIAAEVTALFALVMVVLFSGIPPLWVLHSWLIPMLLINTMVNIRGMSQHTLLEHASDPIQGTRSILTHAIVRFFMCNENYHLEHHLYPGIPWHSLPRVHQTLQGSLRSAGAPYIGSYAMFVREFLIHSIKRSPLGRKKTAERP
jgi:fatty acid desaturase